MKMLKKTHQKASTHSNQMQSLTCELHSLLVSQLSWMKRFGKNDDKDEGLTVNNNIQF